jgi:hypothetical protein
VNLTSSFQKQKGERKMAKKPFNVKYGLDVGSGKDEDVYIRIYNDMANSPALRYKASTNLWEVSEDGVTYKQLAQDATSVKSVYEQVSQSTHGFDNDFIYHNGTNWVKAQANDKQTCATHFAVSVDSDNFLAYCIGDISVSGMLDDAGVALSIGTKYYLSQTVAGKVTNVEPTVGIIQFVMAVKDSGNITIAIDGHRTVSGGGGGDYTFRSVSAETTTTTDDDLVFANGTFDVNILASASFTKPITIKNIGTGTVSLIPNLTETIDGESILLLQEYDSATLMSDGTNIYII